MKRLTDIEFKRRARKVHGSKKYDYSLFRYLNNRTKGKIICNACGHIFKMIPCNHLQGQGCPKCAYRRRPQMQPKSERQCIVDFKAVHGSKKYDYSLFRYLNNRTKGKIICNACEHIFTMTPRGHLYGHGCPKCAHRRRARMRTKSERQCIIDFKEVYGRKRYDYSLFCCLNSYTKGKIKCNVCGHIFEATPNNHLRGHGCPKCARQISKAGSAFLTFIGIPADVRRREVRIGTKRVDGANLSTRTVYEFLGSYWHGDPRIYKQCDKHHVIKCTFGTLFARTERRFKQLVALGYTIKYVWEKDWKAFKKGTVSRPRMHTFNGKLVA